MSKEQDADDAFRKRWPNGTLRWMSDRPNMTNMPREGSLSQFAAQSMIAESVLEEMRRQIREDAERAGYKVTEIHDSMVIDFLEEPK